MASLKLCASLDSKHHNVTATSSHLSGQCSVSAFPGAYFANSFHKIRGIGVSRVDADLSDIEFTDAIDNQTNDLGSQSSNSVDFIISRDFRRARGNVWKRFKGVNKVVKNMNLKLSQKGIEGKNDGIKEPESKPLFVDEEISSLLAPRAKNVLELDIDVLELDMNVEQCNIIMKQLERTSDVKALKFFEWMRINGKLKENVTAYNLALRVVGRKEDWVLAEAMVQEMVAESGCELNFQVFNTLIYACYKRGLVELGSKWFHMMLSYGVRANEATFGMLMNLYQKGRNVEEAEFAFSQMRTQEVSCRSAYSAMITIYTRLGLYSKAEEVISMLRGGKIVLNIENWMVLVNAYSQQGKMKEAEMVLVSMREAGVLPTIIAYNALITGYGKVSKMDVAESLFQNLRSNGLDPDEATYRSMIEGWGRANNYKEARRYYDELKRVGFQPNSTNLYTMINLQAKHDDEEGAVTTVEDMVRMGCQYSSILGILLQSYEKAERFNKLPQVVRGSFYDHVLSNQTSCSILVMAYVKHGLVNDVIEILEHKRWKDRNFEDNLYHLLICSCKDMGRLENAVKIYAQMPKTDEKPNLHITCTMIEIYSAMRQFTEAENLHLKLKTSGIAFDVIAFSVVVRMYVRAGKLEDACSVLETMDRQKSIVPDIYLLRDMFRIYQRRGMLEKLSDLYYKLVKAGVTWDQEMYNCVINCCARALSVDELSRVFDEMLQRGFAPSTITLNVMLNVYGKAKLFPKVRKVFSMARSRGLADVISYNTVVAAYGKGKLLKNMSSSVKHMQLDGFSVSLEAYNCMLDAYGKESEMEKFRIVLEKMRESRCASDNYTYNIMINIYGELGWIEEVAEVLTELKECGLKPDLISYNTLIKAYGIAGMVEDAVNLVKEMRENGIEPDKITYNNLILALWKNDKLLEAVKWSLWMKQIGLE